MKYDDFYYLIMEIVPDDATIEVTDGTTTQTVKYKDATDEQKAQLSLRGGESYEKDFQMHRRYTGCSADRVLSVLLP